MVDICKVGVDSGKTLMIKFMFFVFCLCWVGVCCGVVGWVVGGWGGVWGGVGVGGSVYKNICLCFSLQTITDVPVNLI